VNVGLFDKLKLWPETWTINTVYSVGDVVKPTAYASHAYKCTTAGTSDGAVEPVWSIVNGVTTPEASGTCVWLCSDQRTYQVKAPQGATVPYVTFGLETNMPMGTFASQAAMESLTFWVNCWTDKSAADAAEIADEVITALDGAALSVSGYSLMKCIREFMGAVIYDSETGIFLVPQRYRVWVDKN
jgi:hypothetical protein